jgi:FkbM family methyltransferase
MPGGGRALPANKYIRDMHFDFITNDEVTAAWYSDDNQSMAEREWCLDHLRPGDVVVDCGAHHGLNTVIFAKSVGPTGHVFAYEPLPANADIIRDNARINHLDNVSVRPLGLSDHNGVAAFDRNSGNLMRSEMGQERLQVTRLDDDLPHDTRTNFMKIDVEGSELAMLAGAARILEQAPILNLELHNFLFTNRIATLENIFSKLLGRYRYSVLPESHGTPLPFVSSIDLAWLSTFENPHVFCVPYHAQQE